MLFNRLAGLFSENVRKEVRYINYYQVFKRLSQTNLNNVYSALNKLRDKSQLSNTLKIELPDQFTQAEEREVFLAILGFLKENRVVLDFYRYALPYIAPPNFGRQSNRVYDRLMIVQLHPGNFHKAVIAAEKICKGEQSQEKTDNNLVVNTSSSEVQQPGSKDKVLYNVTLTPSNEIAINGQVLSKPHYSNENLGIFEYLLQHPNRDVTKEELSKAIGKSVGKELHKILENIGFKNHLLKTFFIVSDAKGIIKFKNPVKESSFKELNIPSLRIKNKKIPLSSPRRKS